MIWTPGSIDPTWTSDGFDVAVVDALAAERIAPNADHLISLWDTGKPGSSPLRKVWAWPFAHPDAIILEMDDVAHDHDGYIAPTLAQVAEVINRAPTYTGRLLVHCAAGISRSTAMALVVLAVRLDDPDYAVSALLISIEAARRRGWREDRPYPNRAIVTLADDLLEWSGRLVAAVEPMWTANKWTPPPGFRVGS